MIFSQFCPHSVVMISTLCYFFKNILVLLNISDGSGDQKFKVLDYGRNKNLCNTINAQKIARGLFFFPEQSLSTHSKPINVAILYIL